MVVSLIHRNAFKLLWLVDVLLCIGILATTAYTEIDWVAYMQEVEGFLGGDLVYTNLRGDTGPLVYPAGFVYFFSALYYLTDKGRNVALAQWIFMGFYLLTLAIVLKIYNKCRVPLLYTFTLIISKRIHSIFLLRMFNDGIAMMFCYAAILFFATRRWSIGCVLYSVAVSIKMNIFLFAPGLLCLLCTNMKWYDVIKNLSICAVVQLVLGLPFLATDPKAYLGKAFELGRVFDYKWSVNYKFIAEDVFVSKPFGLALLALNVALWALVCKRRWLPRFTQGPLPSTTFYRNVVITLFESNLIGFACCRSMHYQFYVWAFHQIPLVLSLSLDRRLPAPLHLVIYGCFDYGYNTYPSTSNSSFLLMVGSMMPLVIGMLFSRDQLVANRQEDFRMIGGGPSPFDVRVQNGVTNPAAFAAARAAAGLPPSIGSSSSNAVAQPKPAAAAGLPARPAAAAPVLEEAATAAAAKPATRKVPLPVEKKAGKRR